MRSLKTAIAAILACMAITACDAKIKPVHPEKWGEVEQHIRNNWLNYVETSPDLPHPYSYALNPGTLYYWDLYFINEGLMMQGYMEQAKNNIDDFIYEIELLGFIPNALGWGQNRSQTPYFSMMVRSYLDKAGEVDAEWLRRAYNAVRAEYEFWTNTNGNMIEDHRTSVDGLQRFSNHATPDETAYFYDVTLQGRIPMPENATREEEMVISSHRIAEAEVMDFTPRFESRCMDFVAVDLNSNLYRYERDLAHYEKLLGVDSGIDWNARAERRKELINRYCWSDERGLFMDYDFVNGRHSSVASVATFMPLYWGFATEAQAKSVVRKAALFDSPGGLVVCEPSGETFSYQWDDKGVWAPVQFLAMSAFSRYGYDKAAEKVAMKWLNTVTRNFVDPYPSRYKNEPEERGYGYLWEKYTRSGDINDHEYKCSEMMGWTAATYLKALETVR